MNRSIIPKPLQHGATIGIVAPSGRIRDDDSFDEGIRILHQMGFQTKFPRNLWPGCDYLADSDHERGKEFNRIWNDPEVEAVMAARGGYGCIRMINDISFENPAKNPKIFLGFSDISLLHSHLNSKANLVTIHGPVVTSLPRLTRESLRSLSLLLCGKIKAWKHSGGLEILRSTDNIYGRSTGGNLSTIVSTLGTQLDISWKDKIVFLEDTGEPPYRVDRMLTQLALSGKLEQAAAIILGDFSHGLNLDRIEVMRHHETIWKRVLELTNSNTAVWAGFPFGHGSQNHPIPFGAEIFLDCGKAEMCLA